MHSYQKKRSLHMKFDLEGILCKSRKLIMFSFLEEVSLRVEVIWNSPG